MTKRRNTPTKEAVLSSLREANGAMSHEMIAEKLDTKADRATIYRILNRFCEDGLIHRVVADDGKQYFALCADCELDGHQHDHFHFRCLACEKVECLEQDVHVSLPKGYVQADVNVVISGYCSDCATLRN